MVAGITTIAVPQSKLQRKFAKEGVIRKSSKRLETTGIYPVEEN
jgi:hypothetical protein